ncbi:MAG: hypothetical protein WCG25_04320 [bacterium]
MQQNTFAQKEINVKLLKIGALSVKFTDKTYDSWEIYGHLFIESDYIDSLLIKNKVEIKFPEEYKEIKRLNDQAISILGNSPNGYRSKTKSNEDFKNRQFRCLREAAVYLYLAELIYSDCMIEK